MTGTGAYAAGVLVLAFATGGAAHAANLVSDGDFSTPYGGPGFTTYYSGSSFGPWTVTSGSVDLIGGYWQSPVTGGGSVDVDGFTPGSFDQTIATGAGSYTLTFDLSGNPDGPAQSKTLQVSVGGVTKTFTFTTGANSRSNMGYVPETLTFTASGPTTLTFASLDNSGSPWGPVVSDVDLVAGAASVPEPASWALMLLGLSAMGASLRSSRSRVPGLIRT